MSHRRLLSFAALALALTAGTARADEQRTSIMLWGSGLDGRLQVGGGTADFSMSVADIINVLDGSITLRHESRGEDRGWYAELIINDLKQEASGTLGEQQVNLQQSILELGMSKPLNDSWDMYGGVRVEQLDNSIDFAVLPTVAGSVDWTDLLLGVRWHRESSASRWWARGDVAGGGSDGAFLLEAGGAWRFGGDWEFSLAYRALDTSFENPATLLDLTQAGAVMGITKVW